MYSAILLAALAQPETKPADPGGVPPTQMLARIDAKGNLKITSVTSIDYGGCYGTPMPMRSPAPRDGSAPAKAPEKVPVKVKVQQLIVMTAEMPAKHVKAYSANGKAITPETLASQLAKERPVLVALDGKKVDPFLLQLYKDDTIILVPPANTLGAGTGGFGGYGGYGGGPTTGGAYPVPAPSTTPYGKQPDRPRPLPPEQRKRD